METRLPLTLTGTVTRFKGNGRRLGYPTANITTDTAAKDGVYFGYADLKEFKNHPSLIFVGTPTTMGDTDRRVEAYLLDIPDIDHYGEALRVRLEEYHRGNRTFESADELQSVMKNDEQTARQWFAAHPN